MTLTYSRPCDQYVIKEVLEDDTAGYKGLELAPGDVLLDLGAHVGSCVEYALRHNVAHVIAVEMIPDTLGLLRRNFGQDPRVTIVPAAVAAEDRGPTATTRRYRNPMGASISEHNAPAVGGKGIEVPTVTLTGLLAGYQPNKIKFDIEFSEYDVILPNVEAINASGVTHMAGELHTKSWPTLSMAKELWLQLDQTGWSCSKRLDQFPKTPNGWNVHPSWQRIIA
jgi:FkbM family methyltransferase